MAKPERLNWIERSTKIENVYGRQCVLDMDCFGCAGGGFILGGRPHMV
jgi:hypothetical protein